MDDDFFDQDDLLDDDQPSNIGFSPEDNIAAATKRADELLKDPDSPMWCLLPSRAQEHDEAVFENLWCLRIMNGEDLELDGWKQAYREERESKKRRR